MSEPKVFPGDNESTIPALLAEHEQYAARAKADEGYRERVAAVYEQLKARGVDPKVAGRALSGAPQARQAPKKQTA